MLTGLELLRTTQEIERRLEEVCSDLLTYLTFLVKCLNKVHLYEQTVLHMGVNSFGIVFMLRVSLYGCKNGGEKLMEEFSIQFCK